MELDRVPACKIERFDKYIEGLSFNEMLVGVKHQKYLVVRFLQHFDRYWDIIENAFLGFGWTVPDSLKNSCSRANKLPIGAVQIDPVQTRYAVMIDSFALSLPLNVMPLQQPKPDGSEMSSPWTRVTHLLKTEVTLPPAHVFSVDGIGSISCVG
jgi:hypothetical protein